MYAETAKEAQATGARKIIQQNVHGALLDSKLKDRRWVGQGMHFSTHTLSSFHRLAKMSSCSFSIFGHLNRVSQ